MKKSLLATVAAVALIAGAGIASAAEGANDRPKDQPKAQTEMKGGTAVKAEPEMKRGPNIKAGAEQKAKRETTGAGAGNETGMESKQGRAADSSDIKRDTGPRGQGNVKAHSESTMDKMAPTKSAADEKAGAGMSKSSASEKASPSAQGTTTSAQSGKSASLTVEQKTKIRTTVLQSGPKVSRSSINFNISVGTAVPRSVRFVTVPQTIVDIYPEYRGFDYFVVDEQIIIIDPHSLKIIAILDV